jgi:hypothetical protein
MITHILTHPGGAHKDDFLACCVLAATHGAPIERREPRDEDLADPQVCVVDVGGKHEPTRNNFDHHQLPRDHAPICALSLVLQQLGLYADARLFCAWLEPAEWLDSRGPVRTAQWMGVEREVINQLVSPIDVSLLRRFADVTRLEPDDPLYTVMAWVGGDLLDYLRTTRARLAFIAEHLQIWSIEAAGSQFQAAFMPRTEPLLDDPSASLARYLEAERPDVACAGLVYPDRRNTGYGISRMNDDPRLDFTRVKDESDVHFAHASGFVAKTTATAPGRLRALLTQAWVA